jgi:hypothetical protein
MAGAFAHMTLVRTLCVPKVLNGIAGLTDEIRGDLITYRNYCELGSVGPDYPFLSRLDGDAPAWGNVMHFWKTADFIRRAISSMCNTSFTGFDKDRCTAWLFGYAAHVVTDLTIHPIVNTIAGGAYDPAKPGICERHRECEMHQDVYVSEKLAPGNYHKAGYLTSLGIGTCEIDGIKDVWFKSLPYNQLADIHMKEGFAGPKNLPEPAKWHSNFLLALKVVASDQIPVLVRHFLPSYTYPATDDVNPEFIYNLAAPDGSFADTYDRVFDRAHEKIRAVWDNLGSALAGKDPGQFSLANADLDTGLAENGELSMWV